jgi:hypothetical protein
VKIRFISEREKRCATQNQTFFPQVVEVVVPFSFRVKVALSAAPTGVSPGLCRFIVMDCSPGRSQELEADDQPEAKDSACFVELRRHPRFPLHAEVRVYSRSAGLLTGYTVDISDSGISAMLRLDLPIGELVDLEFELPSGPVAIRAMVRHRTAFRYGFQFVEPEPQGAIKVTCSRLALLQRNEEDSAPSR